MKPEVIDSSLRAVQLQSSNHIWDLLWMSHQLMLDRIMLYCFQPETQYINWIMNYENYENYEKN